MPPSNERGRLTRHQRQVQRQKDEAESRKRNQRIVYGGIAGTLLTAATLGYVFFHQRSFAPPVEATPTAIVRQIANEYQFGSSEWVAQQEVIARGVRISQQEKALWEGGFQKSTPLLPINETTIALAKQRVKDTLDRIKQSENPVLSNASQTYLKLEGQGRISISLEKDEKRNLEEGAITTVEIRSNKIHAHIQILVDTVLNKTNAIQLAFLLAHEITHAENIKKFDESLPPALPLFERLSAHLKRSDDYARFVEEEALGNGTEVEAFIEAQRLLQYPLNAQTYDLIPRTAAFINCGASPTARCWRDYTAREIVRGN